MQHAIINILRIFSLCVCGSIIRILIFMLALPLQVLAEDNSEKFTFNSKLCIDDIGKQLTEFAQGIPKARGFALCPNSNFPIGISIMRLIGADPFRHLAGMFAARTPGYRSKGGDGKASFRFKPYNKNVWSVDTFDEYANLDETTNFIWAKDFSFDGRPWGDSSMDWYPVRYFNCYDVLLDDHPRNGLNCETRYHIKTCKRFLNTNVPENFIPRTRFAIKVYSQGNKQTEVMFEHFDDINKYIEAVLDQLLEFSCS